MIWHGHLLIYLCGTKIINRYLMICVTALFLDGKLRHTIWYMYPRYFHHKTDLFHDKYVHPSYLFLFCIIVCDISRTLNWYVSYVHSYTITYMLVKWNTDSILWKFHRNMFKMRFNIVVVLYKIVVYKFDSFYKEYNVSVHSKFIILK